MQNPNTGEMELLDDRLFKKLKAEGRISVAQALGFPANSPLFSEGEILSIKGGFWKIQKIWRGRMRLKSISAAEAAKAGE